MVVLLHITANDERAHAVTEEGERKTREALFDIIGDLVNVRNDAGGRVTAVVRVRDIIAVMALAVGTEVAVVVFRGNAGAVPAMVMDDYGITMPGKKIHKIMVALAVFSHTVNKLDDAFRGIRDTETDAEVKPIIVAFEGELFPLEGLRRDVLGGRTVARCNALRYGVLAGALRYFIHSKSLW